nr:hypothetical protein [uncultured Holophaga sp.]
MTLTALLDLFRHQREGATGVWKLGQEPFRTIFFDAGDIVFAQSSHPEDRLTSLLVERGKLTQTQMDYALGNLKQGMSIGKNLIEMGFITQRDLLEMARLQVERVVQGSLGTPDQVPGFSARELESSVVRLPLDTPLLLLNGLLALRDREAILETLGPLNQVVLLQGRQLSQMNLPADLAKLPPFLDGTHTLLELNRESLAEPLRLGAFALFLREMGWARLHEMPPVDRQALAEVLAEDSEAPPVTVPLPPPADASPTLFSTIEDAARPTTNLEHLSQAFDEVTELPEVSQVPEAPLEPLVDAQGFSAESGQAILPTPRMELPEIPEETADLSLEAPVEPDAESRVGEAESGPEAAEEALPLKSVPSEEEAVAPAMDLTPETLAPVSMPESVTGAVEEESGVELPSKRRTPLLAGLAIVVILVVLGGLFWVRSRSRKATTPQDLGLDKPVQATPPAPVPKAEGPTGGQAAEPLKDPSPATASAPESRPQPLDASLEARISALQKGDMERAVAQGARLLSERPPTSWTLRLELACQPDTLKRAVELFPGGKADLFVRPMVLRDGRGCFQIFLGSFPSAAAAEKEVSRLPAAFRQGGNKPKPFRLDNIPERQ